MDGRLRISNFDSDESALVTADGMEGIGGMGRGRPGWGGQGGSM